LLPGARHLYVDTCEAHSSAAPEADDFVAMVSDRRFFVLDLMLGRDRGRALTFDRPFVKALLSNGGASLLEIEPGHIDTLGLDYYAHSEWRFGPNGGQTPSPRPVGLSNLILEYGSRYDVPLALTETNIRGYASDRATWLKYTVGECERAIAHGANLNGYCWFPFVDSVDWDSLLARPAGHIDPVGVFWLDERLNRRRSTMSRSYAMLAAGASAAALPAYELCPPVRDQIAGFRAQMRGWEWRQPPRHEISAGWRGTGNDAHVEEEAS